MMKILNIGSMNYDYVYKVKNFVRAEETISALDRNEYIGGKGLNQSTALAKAGADVYHCGLVGFEGDLLLKTLNDLGVDCSCIFKDENHVSGHTIIQVNDAGQNCIIVFGGTNTMLTDGLVDKVLKRFEPGDWLLIQHETNNIEHIIKKGNEKGLHIAFNPSPYDVSIKSMPLDLVDMLIVNEIEGAGLAECEDIDSIIPILHKRYPKMKVLLTLGENGSLFFDGEIEYKQECIQAEVRDTTSAGDTFLGYFITYYLIKNSTAEYALKIASYASAITVSRNGSGNSIPFVEEVLSNMEKK